MTSVKNDILADAIDITLINIEKLKDFIVKVFVKVKVPKRHAKIIADVLITADLRGIESHGVQRLKMYYDRIKNGIYNPKTKLKIFKETPTTAVIDGNCGLGPIIGFYSMKLAIKKAKKYGIGAVAVRNSTHFGIAGYYSLLGIKEGMISFVMSNARPSVPPTFGIEPMLGTNPLTFGVPTDEEFPFIIDCATSLIQRGIVEMHARLKKDLPTGLAINKRGSMETDPQAILDGLEENSVALLPMGSNGKLSSSHKGYGYATFVEIMSSALQDGVFLKDTAGVFENGKKRLKVGHFFLVINIENFVHLERFMNNSGNIMRALRSSKKAPGYDRIFTAGEIEYFKQRERLKFGIPINKSVQKDLKAIQEELHLNEFDLLS